MRQDLERGFRCSVNAEEAMHLDGLMANELTLILDQVDNPIAIFNSNCRLVQFNKSLLDFWKLPLIWLQSQPHWDEILDYLTANGQLIDLQAKDIQSYLEHAKSNTCSLKVLQVNGRCLEMQITATTANNTLLVIKPQREQSEFQPDLQPAFQTNGASSTISSAADAIIATQMLQQRMQQQANLLQRSEDQCCTIFDNAAPGIDNEQLEEQLEIQVVAQGTNIQEALRRLHQEMRQRRRLEDELRIALIQEKELNQLKSRFVAMAFHEFGNPLTAIFTASQLLEQENLDVTDKAIYLQMIQNSVEQMNQLVEDILLIGKAEAERVQVKPIELDLNLFCHRILGEMQLGLGKNYHLRMINHCNDPNVCLDAKLLRQILCNLLTNAIKYSPDGGAIQLEIERQGTDVIFQVQDEGIGIPQNDLPHLFKSFNRAGNVGSISGTGLGLAIVKHCVEASGGHISVTSQEHRGTTFRVVLPLQK